MTTSWAEVQKRAAIPGSVVLQQFMAQRSGLRNVSYSDSVMEAFGVSNAASGAAVNATSAMRVSAVFACVQRIAGAIATLPLHVYERTTDGGRKRVDQPIWWLLNEQPTARYSAASHWEHTTGGVLLRGDGFTFIGRDPMGNIKELIPLPWSAVDVQRDKTQVGGALKYYVNDVKKFGVDASDMLHFPGFGFDGTRAMSVIQWAARNATGTAMAMDEYAGRFFANGAHPSIVLQTDSKMNKDQIDKLQSAFANKYSGIENAHKMPMVLTEGLKAQTLSLDAVDSQLLEARKFQVIDIARAFGVPPHMIGETSASTSWGSGIESMGRAFVTYTLQPHLVRIEQELNRKLWPTRTRYFVEFDRDALIEGDSAAQASYFRAAIGGPGSGRGWMTVDEIRKKKNLPPVGGEFGEVYDPAVQAKQDPPPAPEPDPAGAEDTPDPAAEAMAIMALSVARNADSNATLAAAIGVMAAREAVPGVTNVTVEPTQVNIAPTQVTIEPAVTNIAPAAITVEAHMPQARKIEKTPVRDPVTNLVTKIIETEVE
jgi:HK97 family phage portal protein